MNYLNWPVGRIAIEIPGATAIFFKHKINFCCDESRLLSEAIEQKSLEDQPIVDALVQLGQRKEQTVDLANQSNQEIIDYILKRFHEVHREQLAELQRLATRVETVHANNPQCPTGLSQHLAYMDKALNQHMQKEETILFPLLANEPSPMASGPISVMQAEHADHLAQINRIYELTNDVTPYENACNTWRALYRGLQEFITDLNQHIHTENNILFIRTGA